MHINPIKESIFFNQKEYLEQDFTVFYKLSIWSATALSVYSTPILFINSLAIGTLLAMNLDEGVDKPTRLFSFKSCRFLMAAEFFAVTSIFCRDSLQERIAICVALILFAVYLPIASTLLLGQHLGSILYYRENNSNFYKDLSSRLL